jgi:hypothetical protein
MPLSLDIRITNASKKSYFITSDVAAVVAILGAAVGDFWLIAIDSGLNDAKWPWCATCPFTALAGLSEIANVLILVLNGILYVFIAWLIARVFCGRA